MSAVIPLLPLITGLFTGSGWAQIPSRFGPPPLVIENASIITMDGPVIENGIIVIRNGRIENVGAGLEIPDRASRIDAGGGYVTPGLIDVHGALGLTSPGGGAGPTNRAFDAFDRYATEQFRDAVRHGVTALYIPARGGGGINGTGAVVRLVPLETSGAAGEVIAEDVTLCINLASDAGATTRLNTFEEIRKKFRAALDYREALETYEDDLKEYEEKLKERAKDEEKKDEGDKKGEAKKSQALAPRPRRQDGANRRGQNGNSETKDEKEELKKPSEPGPDPDAEILLHAIDHEMPVRVLANNDEDILNAIELAEEFHLKLIIEGGEEAWVIADEIAEAEAPVVLGLAPDAQAAPRRAIRSNTKPNCVALNEADCDWYIGSGAGDSAHSRFVLSNAQLQTRSLDEYGEEARDALRLVTRDAAEFLGVDDQLGRVARGRAADLVIWSGPPGEATSRVMRVYIDGKLVYLGPEPDANDDENGGDGA